MTQVKALLWLGYQRYLLTFGYAQLVPKFLWRSVRLGVGVVGELLTFLDRFEEFFGRGPGDGKWETACFRKTVNAWERVNPRSLKSSVA